MDGLHWLPNGPATPSRFNRHRPLEADAEVAHFAFSEGDNPNADKRQALEQAGGVLLVAAEAVQRFGDHDVEVVPERVSHQSLEPWPQQRRPGDRMVRVLAGGRPAFTVNQEPTQAELVGDGRVTLVVRRVASVEGDSHHWPPVEASPPRVAAVPRSKHSRAARLLPPLAWGALLGGGVGTCVGLGPLFRLTSTAPAVVLRRS